MSWSVFTKCPIFSLMLVPRVMSLWCHCRVFFLRYCPELYKGDLIQLYKVSLIQLWYCLPMWCHYDVIAGQYKGLVLLLWLRRLHVVLRHLRQRRGASRLWRWDVWQVWLSSYAIATCCVIVQPGIGIGACWRVPGSNATRGKGNSAL